MYALLLVLAACSTAQPEPSGRIEGAAAEYTVRPGAVESQTVIGGTTVAAVAPMGELYPGYVQAHCYELTDGSGERDVFCISRYGDAAHRARVRSLVAPLAVMSRDIGEDAIFTFPIRTLGKAEQYFH